MNLLASDNSESPMNARPQPTVDGHTSLEAGTPPTKEGYVSSYSVPWYHKKKWRILMLLGGILLIGAIAGGIAGGILASKNKNELVTSTSETPSTVNIPTVNASPTGALPPGSSQPPVGSASGAETVPTVTGGSGSLDPTPSPTPNFGSADPGLAVAPVVAWSD